MRSALIVALLVFLAMHEMKAQRITSKSVSRATDDYEAEGFLATLPNGDIVHVYRTDPGPDATHGGDHGSPYGKIVQRTTTNGGSCWSDPITIYDSLLFDDRNVHGGIADNGDMVAFFRTANIPYPYGSGPDVTVKNRFMFRGHQNSTWDPPLQLNPIDIVGATHQLIKVEGNGSTIPDRYMQAFSKTGHCEVRFSQSLNNWNNAQVVNVLDGVITGGLEVSFADLGGGKILGLMRRDVLGYDSQGEEISGDVYYQTTSTDYGYSFSPIVCTNIVVQNNAPYYCVSPSIYFDKVLQKLFVFATDRNHPWSQSAITVYVNDASDIFTPTGVSSANYKIYATIRRPYPSDDADFYGYPTIAKKKDGNLLIVFGDRHSPDHCGTKTSNDDVDLFQFDIVNYEYKNISLGQNYAESYKGYINLSSTDSDSYLIDGDGTSGGTASVGAGDYIRILPGFHSKKGSTFKAFIDPALRNSTVSDELSFPGCVSSTVCQSGGGSRIAAQTQRGETEEPSSNLGLEGIVIYPNPATTEVNVEFGNSKLSATVRVYNSLGITMKSVFFDESEGPLNVNLLSLPRGVYIVEVETAKAVSRKTIILR